MFVPCWENSGGKKKKERKEDPETALSVLRGARRGGGGWWGWGGRRPVDSVQGKGLKMLILCSQTQPLKDRSLSLDSSRNSSAEIKIDRWPRISLSNREALKCCCPFFCLKNYKPAFLFFTLGTTHRWLRNGNMTNLGLRNVGTFLLLFFPLWKINYLQGSSSGHCQIRNFGGSSQLAGFGKMNMVRSYILFFFK